MIQNSRAGRRLAMRQIRPRRSPAVPLVALAWAGAAGVIWMWWNNTPNVVGTANQLIAAGRLTGLLGAYSISLVVAQMARVPALESRVGSDRVARWHAMSGRYAISLIVAHVVLTIWGYAELSSTDVVSETTTVLFDYPDMLKALAGTLMLLLVGFVSAGALRRRMRYETWYYLHLLTYAAVFLTFFHQLTAGAEFIGSATSRTIWYALYLTVAALVLWYRVLTPVRLNLRHRMRVESVVEEAPGIVSVLITGRKLHRLGAEAGQFFRWRFFAPGLRWSSNPYSLSAPPRPGLLRITVKAVGGHSGALASLKPGIRVWAEGPYGAMTAARRSRGKVLLLAAGAGITPMRALFETLPAAPGDLTLLYRAKATEDLALWGELKAIAKERGARLMYAVNAPDGSRPEITPEGLKARLPDIDRHDVYMCGPPALATEWFHMLRQAGVPERSIHHESFEL